MFSARARWFGARPEAVLGWVGAALLMGAVYVVVVRGGGLLFHRTSSPHRGLSVLATAIVALTIEPCRVRVEQAARHLLNGGRPPPYEVLAKFPRQVSGPADQTMPRMARMLAEGTAVEWAQVWLLVNSRLSLVATYPADAEASTDPPPTLGSDPGERLRSVPVGHQGNLLGVLRVREHENSPLSPVEQRLLTGLAAQAGLVLHGAQLRAELTARHDDLEVRAAELRRSRDQLVVAQEQERRRLERDIHDGAQQQLVALGVNLRLAQTVAEQAPLRGRLLLTEQASAAADAIDTLSTLSRGLRPRVLSEHGLSGALAAATAASPVPAVLNVSKVGRFTCEVEEAVYFCCLEALQNAVKHADASALAVRLDLACDQLKLTVRDDGSGLAPDAEAGTGLASIRDRIQAVGGQVSVESTSGAGTLVTAVVPVPRVPSQRSG